MTKTAKRKKAVGANVKMVNVSEWQGDDLDKIYVSFGKREFRKFSRFPEGEVIGDEYGVPDRKIWAYVQNENALRKLRKSSTVVSWDLTEWEEGSGIDGYKIVGYELVYNA